MLNLFFPFLNVGAQPKPNAETSPDLDKSPGPGATGPEHGDDVAGHQPVPELQAPRRKSSSARAKHAAPPTRRRKGRRGSAPDEAAQERRSPVGKRGFRDSAARGNRAA